LPLVSTPWQTVVITIAFLVAVYLGKRFMRNRKPFELKEIIIIHNLILVIMSAYMCIGMVYEVFDKKYKYHCNDLDSSPAGWPMAKYLWLFYFSKIVEFGDTFIMVFRKKDDQISFLHLYHHSTIYLTWWFGVYYGPGGESYFGATLNSFVHVWMYGYYTLAALGFRDIWWKKYLTQFQMLQFIVNILHALYGVLFCPDSCNFPRMLGYMMVVYMLSLYLLFASFYSNRYAASKKEKKQ